MPQTQIEPHIAPSSLQTSDLANNRVLNIAVNEDSWQEELSRATIGLGELLDILDISREKQLELLSGQKAERDFRLRVTDSFIRRMRKSDPHDPLLLQILPSAQELDKIQGYSADPLQETSSNPLPGLLHKYSSRVLLTVANSCAVNCRYCFRRHFSYADNNPGKDQWQQVFQYLSEHQEINEAIYSGGDPLVANDRYLAWLSGELNKITHLKRLRIHSRLPVVLPARVTDSLINALKKWNGQLVMVIHSNHPNELDENVGKAILRMRDSGITVLNQSVLLKGINDNANTLAELSEKLFSMGATPYYLHQLDPVQGAAHFEVDDTEALAIRDQLNAKLAGFLVPKLVRETPERSSKTPL